MRPGGGGVGGGGGLLHNRPIASAALNGMGHAADASIVLLRPKRQSLQKTDRGPPGIRKPLHSEGHD